MQGSSSGQIHGTGARRGLTKAFTLIFSGFTSSRRICTLIDDSTHHPPKKSGAGEKEDEVEEEEKQNKKKRKMELQPLTCYFQEVSGTCYSEVEVNVCVGEQGGTGVLGGAGSTDTVRFQVSYAAYPLGISLSFSY